MGLFCAWASHIYQVKKDEESVQQMCFVPQYNSIGIMELMQMLYTACGFM